MKQSLYAETLKDKFTLSPLQQYTKYGRFPIKLVLACALVVMTSIQAIFVSNHFVYNNPEMMKAWGMNHESYALVDAFLDNEDPQVDSKYLFNIDQFQDSLDEVMESLTDLEDTMVVPVDTSYAKVTLEVKYNFPNTMDLTANPFIYELQIGELITQPFNQSDTKSLKDFWQITYQVTIIVRNLTVTEQGYPVCWDVRIRYRYKEIGIIVATVQSLGGVCTEKVIDYDPQLTSDGSINLDNKTVFPKGGIRWNQSILQIGVIILAFLDLFFNLRYIYEVIEMYTKTIYMQTRMQIENLPHFKLNQVMSPFICQDNSITTLKIILKQQRPWAALSLKEKMLFFDLYLPIRIVGNIFQILASGIIFTEGFLRVDNLADYDEMFVGSGFGCFIAWFSIGKYMEDIPGLHLIVSILESSVKPCCLALLSSLPVFLAYFYLGICIFSEATTFKNSHNAAVSLVALIFQDAQQDIILSASRQKELKVALAFFITYNSFFSIVVHNIMVAIVKEQTDMRREIIQTESELMNQFDIQQNIPLSPRVKDEQEASELKISKITELEWDTEAKEIDNQRPSQTLNIQDSFMASVMNDSEGDSIRQRISIVTGARLVKRINKSGGRISQKQLEEDWDQIASQELYKQRKYAQIKEICKSVRMETVKLESDVHMFVIGQLRYDMNVFFFNEFEKVELTTLYCSQLIAINVRLGRIKKKFNVIYQQNQRIVDYQK